LRVATGQAFWQGPTRICCMHKPTEPDRNARLLAGPRVAWAVVLLGFFALFFLYIWLRIEPAIEYYFEATVFFLNGTFLDRFLGYPGGPVECGAAFLAQLNHWSWLGALVFTALGALVFLTARGICRQASGRASTLVCLAPLLALAAWRGRYDGHTLTAALTLVIALGAALTCPLMSRRPVWGRLAAGWGMGAVVYYAAGMWPLLLFLFFAGWFESSRRRNWLSLAGLVLPPLLLPLAWPGLPLPGRILNPWGPGLPLLFACLVFLLLPVGLVALILLPQPTPAPGGAGETPALRFPPRPQQKKGTHAPSTKRRWRVVWAGPAFTVVSLLVGWAVVWSVHDGARKSVLQIEYCAALGKDKQLLAVAQRLNALPASTEVRVHLALYHLGRLLDDLFAYANRGTGALLPGLDLGIGACLPQGQTLLELGQVNEAEHQAHEVLEFDGDRPDVLRLLAKVNILKDRPKAAAVFLNLLCQVPFQRAWAVACLAELERDPHLASDSVLALARSRLVTTDLPHDELPAETMLRQSLASNPRNQMAFEYLMAYYLLTGDFKRLAQRLGQLDDFAYRSVPRHLEEALLLGQKLQGLQFDLHNRKISPETLQRFQSFYETLSGRRGGTPGALSTVAADFGDTYWFYYYSRLAQAPKS
jgi:hypothetical protein